MSTLDEFYPLLPPRPLRHRRHNNGRPNYDLIHAYPLPLLISPLPPLIPHNPLSLLQIAYAFISQLIIPPSSHLEPRIRGYYSADTNSVHITDPSSIQCLWNRGFFGKGSLSRSEPTWLDREKKRLGLLATDTSENHTAARREERKRFKNERARKEREAIEEKLMEELLVEKIANSHKHVGPTPDLNDGTGEGKGRAGKPTMRSKYEGLAEAALLSPTKGRGFSGGERTLPTPPVTPSPDPAYQTLPEQRAQAPVRGSLANGIMDGPLPAISEKPAPAKIPDQEHLQVSPEEAFFLTYALGILDIYPDPSSFPFTPATDPIPTTQLLTLLATSPLTRPNDPFLLLYTTYHHFRSLGWVVRPGLKFGVDYLLYLRGPVFSHAEFAVTTLPAYTHPFWRTAEGRDLKDGGPGARASSEGRGDGMERAIEVGRRSWHWLHCLQRVQSQVRKTLVVAWVDVPPPRPPPLSPKHVVEESARGRFMGDEDADEEGGADVVDITAMLKGYKVREMVVKRWIPNRSRD